MQVAQYNIDKISVSRVVSARYDNREILNFRMIVSHLTILSKIVFT